MLGYCTNGNVCNDGNCRDCKYYSTNMPVPCKKCGSAAIYFQNKDKWIIYCPYCGVETQKYGNTSKEAIIAWNRENKEGLTADMQSNFAG